MLQIKSGLVWAWAALLACSLATAAPPLHTAAGINNLGDVVGDAGNGVTRPIKPFVWKADRGIVALGRAPEGFEWYVGRAVNDDGRILAGLRELATGAVRTAVVSADGTTTIAPAIAATESMSPVDIDHAGRVIGAFRQGSFSWKPGAQPVVRFEASPHLISAMNDRGRVAGYTARRVGTSTQWRALLLGTKDRARNLGTLPGDRSISPFSQARAINNLDQLCGQSTLEDYVYHSFFWSDATGMIDISDAADTQSDCTGINDAGEVIGTRGFDQSAYYWSASTGPLELIDLVDPADPLKAAYAEFSPRAINQSGQVLVMARRTDFSADPAMLVLTPRR